MANNQSKARRLTKPTTVRAVNRVASRQKLDAPVLAM